MFIFFLFIVISFSEYRALVFRGGKQNVEEKGGAKVESWFCGFFLFYHSSKTSFSGKLTVTDSTHSINHSYNL